MEVNHPRTKVCNNIINSKKTIAGCEKNNNIQDKRTLLLRTKL